MRLKMVAGACVMAGLLAPAAQAEDSGFYLGAGVGQSRQKYTGFEGDDTSYRLIAGWSFNQYFAIEGGYLNGGTQSDTIGDFDVEFSSEGLFVEGVAKWPIGNIVAPYAKFGYLFYDSERDIASSALSITESDTNADFIYGGGIEFKLGDNFRLRAEYEEVNMPDSAFDIFSLAATWKF